MKIATGVALVVALSLAYSSANAAIIVDIDRSTREVEISGGYTLLDAGNSRFTESLLLPGPNGDWDNLSGGAGTHLMPSFGVSAILNFDVPPNSASWSMLDAFDPSVALFSREIARMSFFSRIGGNSLIAFFSDAMTFTPIVDAGDLLEISGSFVLDESEQPELDQLTDGEYVSEYNSQTLTVRVSSSIPEAPSLLLLVLGGLTATCLRTPVHSIDPWQVSSSRSPLHRPAGP